MSSFVRRRSPPQGSCLAALLALAALASPGRLGGAAAAAATMGGGEGEWDVVSVNSLLPSETCTSPAASPNSSTLRVVHRHGPCSALRSRGDPPSHAQILARDSERLDAIQRKAGRAKPTKLGGANVTLQARWGKPLGTSNYYISVGLGTPARDLTVEIDTGSGQSWVQCEPCDDCYAQHDPLFDPAKSSTYAAVTCGAQECRQFGTQQNCTSSEDDDRCPYALTYGDNSRSTGNLARDTLALAPGTTLPGFMFGCGHKDAGIFGEVDGLFGLSRGMASLSSQLAAAKLGAAGFSYCLPSTSSAVGYLNLSFGGAADAVAAPANAQFTAMLTGELDASLYYLNLTGMTVAGRAGGTIIDSGTAFSRLPPRAYAALRSAFRRAMARYGYRRAPAPAPFDTCYDLAGHRTVRVPAVALEFGDGAAVRLDPRGVLYAWDEAFLVACLAFAPDHDLGVIGNVQQRTLAVVYDVGGAKIGFGAKGCA
ncbi:unnamed protein product [Urochloa decumbens]|uniref:Peptidase A1 domain-containing protein n=1 Tax=Urochloa decumbens TaxID=240449 RepID=A0ABC9FTG0_9POAL